MENTSDSQESESEEGPKNETVASYLTKSVRSNPGKRLRFDSEGSDELFDSESEELFNSVQRAHCHYSTKMKFVRLCQLISSTL